jgi:hypothetical protein
MTNTNSAIGLELQIQRPGQTNGVGASTRVYMAVKYSEERPEEVRRFNVSTNIEVTIQLEERDGNQFIVIKEHFPSPPTETSEHTVEIPVALLPELKRAVAQLEESFGDELDSDDEDSLKQVSFAHSSEAEFARILDFYHISWEYEPRTFAIEWDADGNVVSSFTPDFFLPEHELYIELTTLKQSLVTKKNRKVRLLRELYPDVNIKILYASDYKKLIDKFAASGSWQDGTPETEPGGGQLDEQSDSEK